MALAENGDELGVLVRSVEGREHLLGLEARADIGSLFRRYGGWLRRALSRRFGPEKAEDLVQETFLRMGPYEGQVIAHPAALLARVAQNVAVSDHRRDLARGGLALRLYRREDVPDVAVPPDQAEGVLLKQIILSMPSIYRDVFVLSASRGSATAEHLGLAAKTVEWRMSKALARCAAKLTLES
ncbi:MAG: RNA polymerase sigma factor [Phenylobacterium sp.]|uniref:RNA polymerase sigma factor n=1 Tax=Phenylobacterium sp. TaxID=1871053 RepID=UPI002732772A|nr:RNA polymerase sigma factor [Phenylobacterium sp.]MDP3747813.1 RNA polymerase sigma factor [Phenylobacterium sp.]